MRIKAAIVILTALPVTALGESPLPKFLPLEAPAHKYIGGWEHFVGGGIASFDCDGDELPELYVAGGADPAQLLHRSKNGAAYIAQTPAALALKAVTGAYPIDIDSDAITDLVILRAGEDYLMRGLGDCAFEEFSTLGFETGDHWTTAFSATWEHDESLPTLAFGTYVDRDNPDGPFGACDATLLYRPDGNTYGPAERLAPGYCALSMLFTDWARNGRADLRISNDRHYYVRGGEEQLWAMEPAPRLYSQDEGWASYQLWGMGIASRDITGDGFADVYLTSMGDQKLQYFEALDGGPRYRDATYERGTTAHRPHVGGDGRPSTGWHAAFGDVNNDGRDDIFVAKGNVEQMPTAAMLDPNSLLRQAEDGRFEEISVEAGIATYHRSRGAALVDLNLDGTLDLAVVNRRAPLEIYEGAPADGHWLLAKLSQPTPNSHAIGAFIELQTGNGLQTREVTIGGGHASGDLGFQHFGLGDAKEGKLRVIWPDGSEGEWQSFKSNQRLTITR